MNSTLKLPFAFDAERLQADYQHVTENEWLPHYNSRDYEGDWTIASLRSLGGLQEMIYSLPDSPLPYQNTTVLNECPYFQEVLSTFQCELTTVRLMNLTRGAVIKPHTDEGLSLDQGEARLHIPVVTNPDVIFMLDGERVIMNEGECWYLDFTKTHSVENHGETDRVHLVIDCKANEWLTDLLSMPLRGSHACP